MAISGFACVIAVSGAYWVYHWSSRVAVGNAAGVFGVKWLVRALRSARLAVDMQLEAVLAQFWENASCARSKRRCYNCA